jgi:MFS family permease
VIFHFANAAMLPMVGEVLSKGKGQMSSLFMSACMIIAQAVMIPVALIAARLTGQVGRKPIFLVGFAVLSIRGLLFALSGKPLYLIGVQSLDGIGAAIFGVLWVLIISDLAAGTGRFKILQGAIIAAWNLGAFLSNFVAGWMAKIAGYRVSFLSLGALAAFGFVFFAFLMPETRNSSSPECEDVSSTDGTTFTGPRAA